jgi:AraC family transcriptional regulator, regulatory protein of adaptative response / DNA-3-methyladenine glycosylase II
MMSEMTDGQPILRTDAYARALDARDARFDGLFFVGITTTRIYCRPVCPARISFPDRRRFFRSAAAAERAGFRPCLRCRPELAPGRAIVYAVSRLARAAAYRIAAGALNGRSVGDLASELGVSERHLRRSFEREIGVTPLELALTHRLLLAKRLLADTKLSITQIAYASGFQSLRRFNAVFRERYRMCPSELRRPTREGARSAAVDLQRGAADTGDFVRLTLAYRPPLDWDVLLDHLGRDAVSGIDVVEGRRYGRTVRLEGRSGVLFAQDATPPAGTNGDRPSRPYLEVDLSTGLLPVLMPAIARLRQLFDLDAEPSLIDAHLEQAGLGSLVRRHPGVRIPGGADAFDVVLRTVLRGCCRSGEGSSALDAVVSALGEPIDTGFAALTRLAPSAERVAQLGAADLVVLGVSARQAAAIVAVARAITAGALRLEPGSDVSSTLRALLDSCVGERAATLIVMRTLSWPDAFPTCDPALLRAARVSSEGELRELAEQWQPWRGYAAQHLWLQNASD